MDHTANRSIPTGAIKVSNKAGTAVAYLTESVHAFYAIGFRGKAGNHSFNYRFRTEARRAQYVADWFAGIASTDAFKANRKSERKADMAKPHQLKVGDVLRSMWGYDQTNVDYYEVTALVGKRMVMIRAIAGESVQSKTLSMQGESVPEKGAYVGEPMRKLVLQNGDSVSITSYANAYLMKPIEVNGVAVGYNPSHWTAYA